MERPPFWYRNQASRQIRKYFEDRGLEEVVTPLLVTSGALEPYLDSFEFPEYSYYLPTSPEFSLKKQLALQYSDAKGIFELAHAFRKETLSKQHAHEFIMVEWYRNRISYMELAADIEEILRLISPKPFSVKTMTVSELFSSVFSVRPKPNWGLKEYRKIEENFHTGAVTEAKNPVEEQAAAVEVFSILYDHAVLEYAKKFPGLLLIQEFPAFVRGMAQISESGWALRLEAIYNGIELANGYQEMNNEEELRKLWKENNQIREFLGLKPHPVDENLLALTPKIQAAGMAMGLERTIMALYGLKDISQFSKGFTS